MTTVTWTFRIDSPVELFIPHARAEIGIGYNVFNICATDVQPLVDWLIDRGVIVLSAVCSEPNQSINLPVPKHIPTLPFTILENSDVLSQDEEG